MREDGREREEGGDLCCVTEMLEFISAQQTSLLHTSHDELTELPASVEGGE